MQVKDHILLFHLRKDWIERLVGEYSRRRVLFDSEFVGIIRYLNLRL